MCRNYYTFLIRFKRAHTGECAIIIWFNYKLQFEYLSKESWAEMTWNWTNTPIWHIQSWTFWEIINSQWRYSWRTKNLIFFRVDQIPLLSTLPSIPPEKVLFIILMISEARKKKSTERMWLISLKVFNLFHFLIKSKLFDETRPISFLATFFMFFGISLLNFI